MGKAMSQRGWQTLNKHCHYEVKSAATEFGLQRSGAGAASLSFSIWLVGGSNEMTADRLYKAHSIIVVNNEE